MRRAVTLQLSSAVTFMLSRIQHKMRRPVCLVAEQHFPWVAHRRINFRSRVRPCWATEQQGRYPTYPTQLTGINRYNTRACQPVTSFATCKQACSVCNGPLLVTRYIHQPWNRAEQVPTFCRASRHRVKGSNRRACLVGIRALVRRSHEEIAWALMGTGIFGIGRLLSLNFVVARREPETEKLDGRRGWSDFA
jgi:hypothetical protein